MEPISWRQFQQRWPYYRSEGMTPGRTKCKDCGFPDFLVLNAETFEQIEVEMHCAGCNKLTRHLFNPIKNS